MAIEVRIGINGGAGRIGKLAHWQLAYLNQIKDVHAGSRYKIVVGAINDLASTDDIVSSYQKRDQTHGDLGWNVAKISDNEIRVNDNVVDVYHCRNPAEIPWAESGTKIVAECTGLFADGSAVKHKSGGAERIVVSAPAKQADATLAMGINHEDFDSRSHYVISNASCTTKALAMPIKVMKDAGVNIYSLIMDTAHSATNTQRVLQFGAEYGVLDEIQTAKTGAAVALTEFFPELKEKMSGYALRTPTKDGSFANMMIVGSVDCKNFDAEYLNLLFERAEHEPKYARRISYFTGQEASTSDIIGNAASSVIVASKTAVTPIPGTDKEDRKMYHMGICSGYDNELAPSRDLALLVRYIARQTSQ